MSPIDAPWIAGLVLAAVSDARTGRIPNLLTFPMMALGIVVNLTLGGDPLLGLLGCAAGFGLHYPLWVLKVQKAGDAKLFMALGAWVGWREVLEATVWYAVVYVPVGLLVLAAQGKLPNLWRSLVFAANKARGRPPGPEPEQTLLRIGPVILVAGLLGRFTEVFAGLTGAGLP